MSFFLNKMLKINKYYPLIFPFIFSFIFSVEKIDQIPIHYLVENFGIDFSKISNVPLKLNKTKLILSFPKKIKLTKKYEAFIYDVLNKMNEKDISYKIKKDRIIFDINNYKNAKNIFNYFFKDYKDKMFEIDGNLKLGETLNFFLSTKNDKDKKLTNIYKWSIRVENYNLQIIGGRVLSSMPIGEVFNIAKVGFADPESKAVIKNQNTLILNLENLSIPIWFSHEKENVKISEALSINNISIQKNKSVKLFSKLLNNNEGTVKFIGAKLVTSFWESELEVMGSITLSKIDASVITPAMSIKGKPFKSYSNISLNLGDVVNLNSNDTIKVVLDEKLLNIKFFDEGKSLVNRFTSLFNHDRERFLFVSEREIHFILKPEEIKQENQIILDNIPVSVGSNTSNTAISCNIVLPLETSKKLIIEDFIIPSSLSKLNIQTPLDTTILDIPIDGFICIDHVSNNKISNTLKYTSSYGKTGKVLASQNCLQISNKIQLTSEDFRVNEIFNLIRYDSEIYKPGDQPQLIEIHLVDVKLHHSEHRMYTGNTTKHTIPVSIIDSSGVLTQGDLLKIILPQDSKIKFLNSNDRILEIPIESGIKEYTYDILIDKTQIGNESITYIIETDYWYKEYPMLLRYGVITVSSEVGAIIYDREKNKLPKIILSGIEILAPDDEIYLSLFDNEFNEIKLIDSNSKNINLIKLSDLEDKQIINLFSEVIKDTTIKTLNLEIGVSISSGQKEIVNVLENVLVDIAFRVEFNNPQMMNYWISNDNIDDYLDIYLRSNKSIQPYFENFNLEINLPSESGMDWGNMADYTINNYLLEIKEDKSTLKISVPILDLMKDLAIDTLVHIASIPVIEKKTNLRRDFQILYNIDEIEINKSYKRNGKFFSYYKPEISIVKSTEGKFNRDRTNIYLPRKESLKIKIDKLLISESLPNLIDVNTEMTLWFENSEWYWVSDDFTNYGATNLKINEIPSDGIKLEQLILSISPEVGTVYSIKESISNLSAIYEGSIENLNSTPKNIFISIDKGNGLLHKLEFPEKLLFADYDININNPTNIIWSSNNYQISEFNISSKLINSDELLVLKLFKKAEGHEELLVADWDSDILSFLLKNNIVGLKTPKLETLSTLSFKVDESLDSLRFISLRHLPIGKTSERDCEVFLKISFDSGKNYTDIFHVGNIISPSKFRFTDAGVNQLLTLPYEQQIGAIEIVENLKKITLKEGNTLILTHTSDVEILSENDKDIIITGSAKEKLEFIKIENLGKEIIYEFLIKDDFDIAENVIFNGITFKTQSNRLKGKVELSYAIKDKNSSMKKIEPIKVLGDFRIHPFIMHSKIDTIYTLANSKSSFSIDNISFEQNDTDLSIYKGDTLMFYPIDSNSQVSFSKNQLQNESFKLIWGSDTLKYIYNGSSNLFNFNLFIDRPHTNSPQNFIKLGGLISFKYKRNDDDTVLEDVFGNKVPSSQKISFDSRIKFAFSNGVPFYSMIDSVDFLINWGKQIFPNIIITEDSLMQTMSIGTIISISIPEDLNAKFSRKPSFDKEDSIRNLILSDNEREISFEIRRPMNINESIKISNISLGVIDYPLTIGYDQLEIQIIKPNTTLNIASDPNTGKFRFGDVSIFMHENSYITKDKKNIDYIGIEYNQISNISNFLDFNKGSNLNSIAIKLDRLPGQTSKDGKFLNITSSLWSERDDAEVKIDDIKDGGKLLLFHMNTKLTNEADFSIRNIYFEELPKRKNPTEYKLSLIRQSNGNVLSTTNESILVDYNKQAEKICDIINKITIGFIGGEREILKSNILSIKKDNNYIDLDTSELTENEFRLVDFDGFDKSSSYKIKFKIELNENIDKPFNIQPSIFVNDCGGHPLKALSSKLIKHDGEGFLPFPKKAKASTQKSRNIKSLTISRKDYKSNDNSLEFNLSLDFNFVDCSKAANNYIDFYDKLWSEINLSTVKGFTSSADPHDWEMRFNRMVIEIDKENECGNFTSSSIEINYLRSLAYLVNNQINECEATYSKAKGGGIEDEILPNGLKFKKNKSCSGKSSEFADGLIEAFIETMEENQKTTDAYIKFKQKDKKEYYKFTQSILNNYIHADSILNKIYTYDDIGKKLKNNCNFCKADLDLGLVFSDFKKIEYYTNKKSKRSYKRGRFTNQMCAKIKGGNKYTNWREDRRNKYEYLYSLRDNPIKNLKSYENRKRIKNIPIMVKIKDSVKSESFTYPVISSRNNLNVDGTRIRSIEENIYLPTTGIYRLDSPHEEDGKHLKFFGVLSFSLLAIMIGSSY